MPRYVLKTFFQFFTRKIPMDLHLFIIVIIIIIIVMLSLLMITRADLYESR
jgi:hypothetical protein